METNKYFIIDSTQSDLVNFSFIPGYNSFDLARKSQDSLLFVIKIPSDQSSEFLDNITLKWGPFTEDDLEIIFLEPTWKKNIYLTN